MTKWQVILSNLLYMIFISTEHASWEPAVGRHHKSMDSILERYIREGCKLANL